MSNEPEVKPVAKAAVKPEVTKVDFPAELSKDDLLRMLQDSLNKQAEANTKLAEALFESRKPYVDPKVLEARKREAEERKKMIDIELRQRIGRKQACPHVRENGTSRIQWMEHSNGVIKGVCGHCAAEFDARNPADANLLRGNLKAIKNMGRAGSHARKGVGEFAF